MGRTIETKSKPVDQWTVKDWEIAYNAQAAEMEKLRSTLRRALQVLSTAV